MNQDIFSTTSPKTWCPGCPNHQILDSAKIAFEKLGKEGIRREKFAITSGIGCHAKIFDYLNLSGVYALHGRAIPTATGIKLGNPDLSVIAFAGDGDTYAEGMAHFIHAGRFNPNITLIVHDNQSFSLTTGQATPTSQKGFVTKNEPEGDPNFPMNPVKLALSAGVSFIARCNARDIEHSSEIIVKAIKHKGFSFIEILQDCLIFNKEINNKDEFMHKIEDNKDLKKAYDIAGEWDYSTREGKIPLGVIYQEEKPTLEEKVLKNGKINSEEIL